MRKVKLDLPPELGVSSIEWVGVLTFDQVEQLVAKLPDDRTKMASRFYEIVSTSLNNLLPSNTPEDSPDRWTEARIRKETDEQLFFFMLAYIRKASGVPFPMEPIDFSWMAHPIVRIPDASLLVLVQSNFVLASDVPKERLDRIGYLPQPEGTKSPGETNAASVN